MQTDNTTKEVRDPGVSNMMLRCCGFPRASLSGKRAKLAM